MNRENLDIDREREAHEYANAQPRDIITVKMDATLYHSLDPETKELIEIQYIEPDFDYSGDKLWQLLRKDASKAYKEKKKREYDLRHRI